MFVFVCLCIYHVCERCGYHSTLCLVPAVHSGFYKVHFYSALYTAIIRHRTTFVPKLSALPIHSSYDSFPLHDIFAYFSPLFLHILRQKLPLLTLFSK